VCPRAKHLGVTAATRYSGLAVVSLLLSPSLGDRAKVPALTLDEEFVSTCH